MTSTPKVECRSVIKFCHDLGHTPTQTFQMIEKAGMKCSKQLVFKWHRRFKEGRTSIDDDERQGRPATRLSLVDFRVFPVLKDQLRGVHFESGEELVAAAQRIVQQFNSEWYEDTYSMWVRRAEKCVRVKGNYVEKC